MTRSFLIHPERSPLVQCATSAGLPVQCAGGGLKGTVSVRTNYRLELAGDWSDLPAYWHQHGGRVINIAADVEGFALTVTLSPLADPCMLLVSLDAGKRERIDSLGQLRLTRPQEDPFFLTRAVLAPVVARFSESGRSLEDLLLSEFQGGIRLETNATAPRGSGLGTSSILTTAIQTAIRCFRGELQDVAGNCIAAYTLEQAAGLGSGWQDAFGGSLPGIKDIRCGIDGIIDAATLSAPCGLIDDLTRLCVLAFSDRPHFSVDIVQQVSSAIEVDSAARQTLTELTALCEPARKAVETGDYEQLGTLANEITALQKRLHPYIISEHMNELFRKAASYCHGSRVCGAGHGGFMLFYTKSETCRGNLTTLLDSMGMKTHGFREGKGIEAAYNNQTRDTNA